MHRLLFIQIEVVQLLQHQLWEAGLGPQVQPLPPQEAGSERQQQPAGFRSEAAGGLSAESRVSTGDAEVSQESTLNSFVTYYTNFLCIWFLAPPEQQHTIPRT